MTSLLDLLLYVKGVVVNVNGFATVAPRGIDAVLPVSKLYNSPNSILDLQVLINLQILEGIDQSPLHITAPGSSDRNINESFPPSYAVHEILNWVQPCL